MSTDPSSSDESKLRDALKKDPADWETRKRLAHLLYDQGAFPAAAGIIWEAEEIPSIDLELAFAARVLAKAEPRKAIRLLTAVLEHDRGKAVQNLGLANALLHHGMVLQAARFYGAALEADPSLGNPDLEHFMLWTDDEETIWGSFKDRKPKLGDLPWMTRDPKEAMKLTTTVSRHTSPVKVPNLKPVAGEELTNDLYQQKAEKGAEPSPPPAVTIPVDRVEPKDRLFDAKRGAPQPSSTKESTKKEPAPVVKKPQAAKSVAPAKAPEEATPATPPTIKINPPKTILPAEKAPGTSKPPTVPGAATQRKLQFASPVPAKESEPEGPAKGDDKS